jgi:putative transposase
MILSEKHIIDNNHIYYNECDKICLLSKNLYNYSNYIVRQKFIETSKLKEQGEIEHAIYLNYHEIRKMVINQFDYINLPRKVSNQTLMLLDKNWKSFFKSIKDWKKNTGKYTGRPKLPKYKNPKNGRFVTTYELGAISIKELRNGFVKLSGTDIKIKTNKSNIKQCRIIPRSGYYVIEVLYEVNEAFLKPNNNRYCAIDLGLDNLATVVSNCKEVKPYIINGKPLKSINQFYNKEKAKIQSNLELRHNKKYSKTLNKITNKRNNKINDYLHNTSRYIINQLVSNNINTLVIGNNKKWKQEINIGDKNNQNFVNIPHSRFIDMLSYKCKLLGINVIIAEESYTSKCSFLDMEDIRKHETYKGRRIKRGLFRSSNGVLINADVNGAYNILRKAVPDVFSDGIEGVAVHPIIITQKCGVIMNNTWDNFLCI